MMAPTIEMLTKAFEEGQVDDLTHELLNEQAVMYADNIDLPKEITDEERDLIRELIIEEYLKGVANCY